MPAVSLVSSVSATVSASILSTSVGTTVNGSTPTPAPAPTSATPSAVTPAPAPTPTPVTPATPAVQATLVTLSSSGQGTAQPATKTKLQTVYLTHSGTATLASTTKSSTTTPQVAPKQGSSVSTGAIAGTIVGIAFVVLALLCVAFFARRRKQSARLPSRDMGKAEELKSFEVPEMDGAHDLPPQYKAREKVVEYHNNETIYRPEGNNVQELDASVSELEGVTPERYEMG